MGMPHDSPSPPTVKILRGLPRSSQEIRLGTTTRITRSRIPYLVRLIVKGKAMNVIITTTGLKLGELKRKPRATSIRPWPRDTPQAVGTAQFAHTPIGTPTSAPFREFK